MKQWNLVLTTTFNNLALCIQHRNKELDIHTVLQTNLEVPQKAGINSLKYGDVLGISNLDQF